MRRDDDYEFNNYINELRENEKERQNAQRERKNAQIERERAKREEELDSKVKETKKSNTSPKKTVSTSNKANSVKQNNEDQKEIGKNKSSDVRISISCDGKKYSSEFLVEMAKSDWENKYNKDQSNIKEIKVYIKPLEKVVYYEVNKQDKGMITL